MVEAWDQKVSKVWRRQVQGLFSERGQYWRCVRSPVLWPGLRHPGLHRRILFQTPGRLGASSFQVQERNPQETWERVICVAADLVLGVTHVQRRRGQHQGPDRLLQLPVTGTRREQGEVYVSGGWSQVGKRSGSRMINHELEISDVT